MEERLDPNDVKSLAAQFDAEIRALPVRNTPNVRAVRRAYSKKLKGADPRSILDLVHELVDQPREWTARTQNQSDRVRLRVLWAAHAQYATAQLGR